jgi:adenosylmethionine-8-amino-7-oxononanoate aminotransferase
MSAPSTILDGPALWSAQAHIPSIMGRQLVIERGEGSFVYTTDGQRLFDGTAGLFYANIGHAHPELADAAHAQTLKLETYHIFARFVNDTYTAIADYDSLRLGVNTRAGCITHPGVAAAFPDPAHV